MRSILLLAAVLAACGETVSVEAGTIEERIVARAIVEPVGGIAGVAASRSGRVVEVRVEEAERVEAGQVLARVDAPASIELIELVAPIDGVVLARRADVGDDVSSADGPLFEVADRSRVRLRFELEDRDAARARPGMILSVTERGGRAIAEGTVLRLSSRMEPRRIGVAAGLAPEQRLVRAGWASLGEDDALALGRELEVVIRLASRRVAARVPHRAIVLADGRALVRVPGLLGDAEVDVTLGAGDARSVEVSGVAAGTLVRAEP